MDNPYLYEIRVEGHLADRWSDWFEGLTIRNEANDDTILTGVLADQAALYGVLTKIHNLNLVLVSVQRSDCDESQSPSGRRANIPPPTR